MLRHVLLALPLLVLLLTGCPSGDDDNGGGGSSVGAPTISTTTLPAGSTATAYSQTLAATGGTAPYTWGLFSGALAPGLSLSTSGTLSGTPTAGGTFNFSVIVLDASNRADTQALSLTISAAGTPPDITSTSTTDAELGTAYNLTLTATGGTLPYTWSLASGTLPGGLTLSAAGVISGTPNATGTFNFTVQVTDNGTLSDTQALTLEVLPQVGPLAVLSREPDNGANVAPTDTLRMTFNRALNPATVNLTVELSVLGGPVQTVAGTTTVIGSTNTQVVFSANAPWPPDALITATFGAGLQSFNGVPPAATVIATFTTLAGGTLVQDSGLGRSSCTATTLLDGRVLIAGGNISSTGQTSCFLLDPATGAITPTGSLVGGRHSHVAWRLANGNVAVLGGTISTALGTQNNVEIFNPTTGTWSPGATITPRTLSAAVYPHASGRWIVVGGMNSTSTTAGIQTAIEVLSPDALTVDVISAQSCNSAGFSTQLSNGDIVIAGRDFVSPTTSNASTTVRVIDIDPAAGAAADPITSVFTAATTLPNACDTPTLAKFPADDRVVAFSNATGNVGDVSILTVTYTGSTPSGVSRLAGPALGAGRARNFVNVSRLPDGNLLFGPGAPTSGNALAFGDLFVPGAVGQPGSLLNVNLGARRSYAACECNDGRVALIAGRSGGLSGPLRFDVELLNIETLAQGSMSARPPICVGAVPTGGSTGLVAGATSVRLVFSGELDLSTVQAADFEWVINGGAAQAPASVSLQIRREVVVQVPTGVTLAAGNSVTLRLATGATLTDRAPAPNSVDTTRGVPSSAWTVR